MIIYEKSLSCANFVSSFLIYFGVGWFLSWKHLLFSCIFWDWVLRLPCKVSLICWLFNLQRSNCHWKIFPVIGWDFLSLNNIQCTRQVEFLMKEIYFFLEEQVFCYIFFFHQSKKFLVIEGIFFIDNFHVEGRNFLSEEESSRQRKFLAKGRNSLSEEEISCQGKKFTVRGRNLLLEEDFSCQRKTFSARGRNSLSEEEIYCRKKNILDRGKNFFSEQKIYRRKKFLV